MKIKCPHCGEEHSANVEICPSTGRELGAAVRMVGRQIGKYRVVRLIAEGGMGAVFEAEHGTLGRKVALKVLHPRFLEDRDIVKRFTREAKAAAKIGHENIIDVIDVDQEEETGVTYIVMECLEGQTLAQRIEEKGALPVREAVDVILQVLSALQASHRLGIIHRDLKPENIFITKSASGRELVKILDFGTAKIRESETASILTGRGTVLGTPHYMAPELLEAAGKFDHRVDLYACGILLYESLTSRLPFDAPNIAGIYVAIMHSEPEAPHSLNPRIPRELSDALLRAMSRNPFERFSSARRMALALEPFGSGTMEVKKEMEKVEALARTARETASFADEITIPPRPRTVDEHITAAAVAAGLRPGQRRRTALVIALLALLVLAVVLGIIFF
jgi:serine/threonine protein kinase